MDNEIKEILDDLKNSGYEKLAKNIENVLDYITNLQQENDNLKNIISSVKEDFLNANNELTDYKSRIEKAVEYMKSNSKISLDDTTSIINFYKQLLNILNGKE